MKKRILTYLGMAFLACMVSAPLFAQLNFNMPFNTGLTTVTVGGAGNNPVNFFDNGGPGGNYSDNSNPATSGVTFIPATAGQRIRVNFTSFSTEGSFDALYIYNGTDNLAPQITTGTGGNMSPCTAIAGTPTGAPFQGGTAGGFWGTMLQGRQVFSTSPSGRLHFRFVSDGSVTLTGWTAIVTQEVACAPIAPANVVVGVGPNCGPASATVNVPAVPACAVGGSIRYSVDGGPALPAVPPTINVGPLTPGIHIITWFAVDAGGCSVGAVTSTVNVLDTEPPVITCPANLTFNLDAGECNQIVSYNLPTVSDNCPWGPSPTPVQIPASFIAHGAGVVTYAGNNAPGGLYYSITNTSNQVRTINGFGIRYGDPNFGFVPNPVNMQVYARTGGYAGFENNNAGWTNLGPQVVNTVPYFPTGTGALAQMSLTAPQTLAPGATVSFHIFGTNACPIANWNGGVQPAVMNGGFTVTGGAWASGLFTVGVAGGTTQPNIQINYAAVIPAPVPVQTSGLPSGSQFPVGTTNNCFSVTDFAGNTSSCCFSVTVLEFTNPTQQLACNDHVQISLDQNCIANIGADDILEGGNYGCYDTRYSVMIITPMGGTISPAIVNASYIGNGPHTVKVTDVVTGQSCWGTVTVEDKLPPVIVCRDINVDCTADLNDPAIKQPAPFVFDPAAPVQFPASFVAHGGGTAYTLATNNGPQGDFWNITNNSALPIQILGFGLRSPNPAFGAYPSPASINLYTRPTFVGFETNPAAWTSLGTLSMVTSVPAYFATGTGPLPQVVLNSPVTIPAGGTRGFHMYSPNFSLVFNFTFGVQPPVTNGILTLLGGPSSFGEFGPLFQPQNNTIPNIQVNYAVQLDAIPVTDNCTNPVNLTSVDSYTNGQCGSFAGKVTRTWTATDAYGNSASCVQMITIDRPVLADLEVPADVQWTCEQYNAFPNIIGPAHLHRFITDTDPSTEIINVNLDPNSDDLDLNLGTPNTQDNPLVNSTNIANGGLGSPGSNPFSNPPTNGLDDADVLALTGSGVPTIGGLPLKALCGITYEYTDLTVNVCPGTFKIVRRWTLIDWCANPVGVVHYDQLIKVVDDKAPIVDLFAVAGADNSNYGTSDIPALGNGGGCNQEPQLSGGTQYLDPRTASWQRNA